MTARILIVEDDAGLRDALASMLVRRGYEVVVASSGNAAIERLADGPPVDLVLSDYYMPDGDGRQLLAFVRERHPRLPVFILVTGQADLGTPELIALGAQALLHKPVSARTLVATLAAHLAG